MFLSKQVQHGLIAGALIFTVLGVGVAQAASPQFLEQNWSKSTRQEFYTTSQGSQIMPYKWFKALERAESDAGFFADGLRRHGYIPNFNKKGNPDKLPIGFVVDKHLSGWWAGLTCAACHTNQIDYNSTALQIDGVPTQADMYGLIADIRDAVQVTVKERNGQKFFRFAKKMLRKSIINFGYSEKRADKLYEKVARFSKSWTQYVSDSTSPTPWGRARLDAFGMIFNRVSNIDLKFPANNRAPDAPASYPFLSGASWEDKVQWNGIASNKMISNASAEMRAKF